MFGGSVSYGESLNQTTQSTTVADDISSAASMGNVWLCPGQHHLWSGQGSSEYRTFGAGHSSLRIRTGSCEDDRRFGVSLGFITGLI